MLDASSGGTFMLKSEDEAWALFDNLSSNFVHHAFTRHRAPAPKAPKAGGLFEVGYSADVTTQVVDAITRKLDKLMVASLAPNFSHMHTRLEPCSFCSSLMHHINDYSTTRNYADISNEQVNAAFSRPSNDPYSNTYNRGWRNQAQSNKQPYQNPSTYWPPQ